MLTSRLRLVLAGVAVVALSGSIALGGDWGVSFSYNRTPCYTSYYNYGQYAYYRPAPTVQYRTYRPVVRCEPTVIVRDYKPRVVVYRDYVPRRYYHNRVIQPRPVVKHSVTRMVHRPYPTRHYYHYNHRPHRLYHSSHYQRGHDFGIGFHYRH